MIGLLVSGIQSVAEFFLGELDDVNPATEGRAWKERGLVIPVTASSSVYRLVVEAARMPPARMPESVRITAGPAVRARRGEEKAGHLAIGAATLMVLPPDEMRAVLARALALALGPHPPRSRLRPGWTLDAVTARQYQGDEAMTRVASGRTAAAALLHQAVAAHRFAGYRAERDDGTGPTDVYAGWRERHDDEADRARYSTGFDLDATDAVTRQRGCPPLRERLARLTAGADSIPLFPAARPAVEGFAPAEDRTLSRATVGRPGQGTTAGPGARRRWAGRRGQ